MYIHFIIPLNYLNSTGFSQHIYTHTAGYPSHMNSYEFNVWVSQNTAGSGNGVRHIGFDNNTTSGDTIYLGSPTRLRGERKSRFVLQHAMNGTGNDELTQLSPAGSGFKQSILISITEKHM